MCTKNAELNLESKQLFGHEMLWLGNEITCEFIIVTYVWTSENFCLFWTAKSDQNIISA